MSDDFSPDRQLSLVIAAYNEEEALPKLIDEIIQDLRTWEKLELIIVDDGSTDQTASVMQTIAKQHTTSDLTDNYLSIHLLSLPYNQGMGAALKAGFYMATLPWVTFLPGDGQIEPKMIHKLCDLVDPQTVLVTSQYANREYSFYRHLLSKGLRLITYMIVWVNITSEGMYLIRRDVLQNLSLVSDSFMLNLEIPIRVATAKHKVMIAEIDVRDRLGGVSHATQWKRILSTFKDLVYLRWCILRERLGRSK